MAACLWGAVVEKTSEINSQQKHNLCTIFNKIKFEHTSELFKSSKILNVYKLNIFTTAVFMHNFSGKSAPRIFLPTFRKPSHSYPTPFAQLNYVNPIPELNKCKYRSSYRGRFIWNNFLSTTGKQITHVTKFRPITKSNLLSLENEVSFFQYQIVVLSNTYPVQQLN